MFKYVFLSSVLLAPLSLLAGDEQIKFPTLKAEAGPRPDERFYENRMDIAYESAVLFDVAGNANSYVFSPQIISLRWQLDDVGNEGWRRGNTEWIFSGFYSPVFEGPEDHFSGAMFGPRYNFVQEGWDLIPYAESRVGFGFTNSGTVTGAQGQDFMFTFAVGLGVRYLVNERLDISLGALYQHYSNGGLSEPGRPNNGLDAIGPVLGLNWKF
jgi:hypothetical protein